MILYHFCPSHLLAGILKDGLNRGVFPIIDNVSTKLLPGYQWLTKEPDPALQSWATRERVFYDRTEYRLTLNIPLSRVRKLVRASDFVKNLPSENQRIIFEWEGHANWYIYKGAISKKWIKKVERPLCATH